MNSHSKYKPDELLTPHEVAEVLKVKPKQVCELLRKKELTGTNITPHGRRKTWRVSPDALQEFLNRNVNLKPPRPSQRHIRLEPVIEFV